MTNLHPTSPVSVFRSLHRAGCFVMPNPWDVGSAILLRSLGFRALATTSAGAAFSCGKPDTVKALPVEAVFQHVREIVTATHLPVSADFQAGYADDPEGLAVNVTRCVHLGVAGLSIEDATGDPAKPLFDRGLAVERVRAARAAIDAAGIPVVLTARCEAALVGDSDPLRTAVDRLTAFAEAGADCLFAPGLREPDAIATLVRAVAPKPVNILVSSPGPGLHVAALADLGVRRISVGSALARVAWAAFLRAAGNIADTGSFESLAAAMPIRDLDTAFLADGRRLDLALRTGDVYIDFPFEDVKFRYEKTTRRVYRRFYGQPEEPVEPTSELYHDAIRSGVRITREEYFRA